MKRLITIMYIVLASHISLGQETVRISTLQNELELLKIDTPGLDELININISETTLSNFLLAIAKVHNLNINVGPELGSINIINNFSNVNVSDILVFLVKEYQLDIDFTGNILSVSRYLPPVEEQKEKDILAHYELGNKSLSLDLKNDPLDKVFRKIMDVSGRNLLFSPEIEKSKLTLYLNNVAFDMALEKLAQSNNLLLTKSRDGFYVFEPAFTPGTSNGDEIGVIKPVRRRRANFNYQILDTLQKKIKIDIQNTAVADIIYTLGEDLNLDIFTATPLDEAGFASVTAGEIHFDLLLDKIFESALANVSENGKSEGSNVNYTYKKDGNIYYFGTENQLSLKQIEMIPMMYRSIQLLSNPSGGGQRRAGRNSFNSGNTNFQTNGNNLSQNNSNRGNNFSSNREEAETTSIEEIIPEDIRNGIEIKVDTELNSFIVSGPGAKVERFKNFIQFIDKPVPMILIEVMIMEVNRSAIVETGVSFGIGEEPTNTSGSLFPSANVRIGSKDVNKVIGNFNGFGSLNLGKVVPEFYLDIKAMESNGHIKVLSTPKLSTINGHKAYLSSGQTSYYAVTTQNFIGSQIPVNSEITNYVPIDAELAIEIMPFVAGDGEITLDIQVIQSAFNGERIAEDAPPGLNSREFSSIIRMRDQDVAILGGIEEVKKDDSGSGVPLLSRIPVIKWFFSKKRREDSKRNLNILIKPTIIH